jgi:hypothetical protein
LKKLFLSHLLPYDPKNKGQERLKDGLNEYLLLLNATEQAIEAFKKDELSKFDPLVGENSCQIRAVKIALLASNKELIPPDLLHLIAFSKRSILILLEKVSDLSLEKKSLKCFLHELNIDIELSCDLIFLVKSYILTKTKFSLGMHEIVKFHKNEKTNTKLIKELGDVTGGFADRLIRYLREELSERSVEFVLDITKCPLLAEENMGPIIENYSISHGGLKCSPFYWMTKLIMHRALVSKIPIVMSAKLLAENLQYEVLKKTILFFQAEETGYQIAARDILKENQPVIVFDVVSCKNSDDLAGHENWEEDLLEHNILDLVLACNAAHRQYPDPLQEHKILEIADERYFYHLEKSKEWGCRLDNPSRFFLTHIYCNSAKNI